MDEVLGSKREGKGREKIMAAVSVRNLTKSFGQTSVLDGINLEILSGEFFSVLGPSGCGKTTLLRLIAGLDIQTSGQLLIDNQDTAGVPPRERGVGLVFQNYALFPHLTVGENVAFGLRVAGLSEREITTRVERILDAVHLSHKAAANVAELSGGEQQRVAVARAIVVEPRVLLFDEPLSNLDISLRAATRKEIREIQRRTGITTIYVTHDQEEALNLSDRIAVMNRGKVEQVARPQQLYDTPASAFVAEFLGEANLLRGMYTHNERCFRSGDLRILVDNGSVDIDMRNVILAIKPEHIRLSLGASGDGIAGVVSGLEYGGFTSRVTVTVGEQMLRILSVTSDTPSLMTPGDAVTLHFRPGSCLLFPQP
jgi:ABC-type Fe3+/spermidine/putrescine transport system ATPase subunit